MKYFYKKIMQTNLLDNQIQVDVFSYSSEWSEENNKYWNEYIKNNDYYEIYIPS